MNLKRRLSENWPAAKIGIGLTLLAGLLLWFIPAEDPWGKLSYDLDFLFMPQERPEEVVIVAIDELAYREYQQQWGQMWTGASMHVC